MKLSTCLEYINKALNFPSIEYNDVSLFFNMAITELNTTLHTSIPLIEKQYETFKHYLSKKNSSVILSKDPTVDPEIYSVESVPEEHLVNESDGMFINIIYNQNNYMFYIWNDKLGAYKNVGDSAIGIFLENGTAKYFIAEVLGGSVYWTTYDLEANQDYDLDEYICDDWVILWLIPYVCFKYTVRDGGTAQTFAEELTQGFQQLQETYDIPSSVLLATYADRLAYRETVEHKLPNLNVKVPTLAIYEEMKHARNINAKFSSMYDRGGFGL